MILSDRLRPLRWKLRAVVRDRRSPHRLGEAWAVTARYALFGAYVPSVGPQLRNTAVPASLTIYESHYSHICCSVHFVGR